MKKEITAKEARVGMKLVGEKIGGSVTIDTFVYNGRNLLINGQPFTSEEKLMIDQGGDTEELKDEYKALIEAEDVLTELKLKREAEGSGYSKGVEALERLLHFVMEQRSETAQAITEIDPDAIDDGGELV